MICEMRYTDENIEDWDFRRPLSPAEVALSDEGRFLRERLTYVLRVQEERLLKIKIAVKNGVAEPTEDGEYVVLAHPQHFKEMHCATWLRDYLTSSGRLTNLVGKSLWREWEKYGRIKIRLLPTEVERDDAYLRREADAELAQAAQIAQRHPAARAFLDLSDQGLLDELELSRQPDPETGRVTYGYDVDTKSWWVAVVDDHGRCTNCTISGGASASESALFRGGEEYGRAGNPIAPPGGEGNEDAQYRPGQAMSSTVTGADLYPAPARTNI